MKPANFPARVQRRREGALARLLPDWPGVTDEQRFRAALETERLLARMAPEARRMRSKKRHSPARTASAKGGE